jgi:Tc5 transposase DNA-binding domain
MNGRACRADTLANGRNLNHNEEALLTEWILDLASRGFPPRKWMVEDTANIILLLKNKKPVGKKWFQRYIKRTPEV